jgi:hypothetical protein
MKRLLLPQMVSRAVDLGLWEPRRALDFASEDPDAKRKATLCSLLLTTGKLSETERGAALRMALNGVEALASKPCDRLQLLVGLSAHLDDGLLLSAVQATWATRSETALAALAPRLTQPLWKQALNAALALPDSWGDRARALAVLGPYLPAELIPLALEAAFQLPETDVFDVPTRVICAMAPRLSGHSLERALLYSRFVNSPHRRAKVLAALAQRLEGERKGEAIRQAWESTSALGSDWERAEALGALAPHLTGLLLERALGAAMTLGIAKPRFLALKALAQRLRGAQRDRALRAAVEAIPQILPSMPDTEADEERAWAVQGLAPQLMGDVLDQCVSVARALESDRERSYALGALATRLSGERKAEVLGEALKAALTGWTQATHIMGSLDGVIALAPQLAGDLAQRALDSLTRPIEDVAGAQFFPGLPGGIVWGRAEALAALAPQLTDQQLRHALEALERMESLLGEKS